MSYEDLGRHLLAGLGSELQLGEGVILRPDAVTFAARGERLAAHLSATMRVTGLDVPLGVEIEARPVVEQEGTVLTLAEPRLAVWPAGRIDPSREPALQAALPPALAERARLDLRAALDEVTAKLAESVGLTLGPSSRLRIDDLRVLREGLEVSLRLQVDRLEGRFQLIELR